ncbi:CaiB/BaiF CoA transferase family protein [Bacillus sp. 2205SS5-2]|uniref:CaiB/BaiF CoA transferase family protein n=1 Tax=Bacillus sp. 2205SS5-2 TaxID=3109031 RepID=UPI00300400B2
MLEGIRVLDFTNYLPGPYATLRLADLGAEIIKIEPPNGDPAQHLAGGLVYQANNRNKQSIRMDLKKSANILALYELLSSVDVIIESFRPGVMKRLRLDYENVKKIKSDIIYCSLSGFGQKGKWAELGSHDLNYQALSGLLSQHKDREGRPIHPTFTTVDFAGGLATSEKVLAALLQRERTGKGSYLDVALNDTLITMLTAHASYQTIQNNGYGPPYLDGSVLCYHIYPTKDQRFVSLAALEPHFWANFCEAVGKQDWKSIAFAEAQNDNEPYKEIKAHFLTKTMDEWSDIGEKYDCCLFPVLEIEEVLKNPYGKSRGLVKYTNDKVTIFTSGTTPRTSAPTPGEHTASLVGIKKVERDEE